MRWGYFPKTEVLDEMALTDTEIKKAKAKEKAYSLNDSGGLYLWITPSGGKLWRWAYRFEGKEKLMSLVARGASPDSCPGSIYGIHRVCR